MVRLTTFRCVYIIDVPLCGDTAGLLYLWIWTRWLYLVARPAEMRRFAHDTSLFFHVEIFGK